MNKSKNKSRTLINIIGLPSFLFIVYQGGSFTITWSQNNDNDFSSYELYESMLEDMSSETLIYETDVRTDTTYVVTGIVDEDIRYYQVVIKDIIGLQSVSNIESGGGYPGVTFGGSGNDGGGGDGVQHNQASPGNAGDVNTGGAGGGGGTVSNSGGSGVVILRMADGDYTGTITGSPTVATGVSGDTVLTFTGTGSYTA